jgi:hypothetical protein
VTGRCRLDERASQTTFGRRPLGTRNSSAGRDTCFSANEQSLRTGSSVRSLLSCWTRTGSGDAAPAAGLAAFRRATNCGPGQWGRGGRGRCR